MPLCQLRPVQALEIKLLSCAFCTSRTFISHVQATPSDHFPIVLGTTLVRCVQIWNCCAHHVVRLAATTFVMCRLVGPELLPLTDNFTDSVVAAFARLHAVVSLNVTDFVFTPSTSAPQIQHPRPGLTAKQLSIPASCKAL